MEVLHARFRRHEYPRHSHEAVTVALVDVGAASFHYRGARFTAPAGCVFALDADVVHTGAIGAPDGYGYRVLYLDPGLLGPLLQDDAQVRTPRFREPLLWDPELRALLDLTHRALAAETEPLRQQEMVLRATAMLFRQYGRAVIGAGDPPISHRAVVTAKRYLEAHATERVTLQDLSAVTAFSPYRLARTFREQVGMPPHEYQMQLRVRIARRMLAERTPAMTVASAAGFCDQAHFTRIFKKFTGVTPGRFIGFH